MTQEETFQQHFEKTFSELPVSIEKSASDLKSVAQHVWFDGFVPDLTCFTDLRSLLRAAYVVDYLASNHLVSEKHKVKLKHCLAPASSSLEKVTEVESFYLSESKASHGKDRDAFAKRWKLSAGMKPKLLGLLDLQRRANQPVSARSVA